MDKIKLKRILNLAVKTSELLLSSGAETYRVEDTVRIMCKSYDIDYVDTFVTPTGIFISLEKGSEVVTIVRRVKKCVIDLHMIESLNNFARAFNKSITLNQAENMLNSVERTAHYPIYIQLLSGGISSSFFTLLFKGSLYDMLPAFIIGFLLKFYLMKSTKMNLSFFLVNFIGAFFVTILSLLFQNLSVNISYNSIIIACIMQLVPGFGITNSIRDTISGDILSGVSRANEAVFIALAIALGVGVGLVGFI